MKTRLPPNTLCSSIATLAIVMLAGCAGRSLNTPEVLDWSSGARPTVTSAAAAGAFYTVGRGDTLASIAARFRVAPADLAAWNNLGPNPRLTENQVLRVAPPESVKPADTNPVATTQPIGGESIEQRPIGTAPNAPDRTTLPPAASPSSSNAPLKTGPLGLKRPYSDAALAELSRADPDAPQTATPPPTVPAPPAATPPATPSTSVTWSWPTVGKPIAGFDDKSKGIDVVGKAGDPVLAAADGKVTFAGTGVRGYGNFVIVQHSPDLLSVYAHNRVNLVKEGAVVTKGQKIAEMGNTDADAVKLHFEIRRDSKPVDPLQFLPPR
jgi:lipoprotein NlpD